MSECRNRFDLLDQEQLAAQIVAIMDAHFQRPSLAEKKAILRLASGQIDAAAMCPADLAPSVEE
jgi:hypothetical protein